MEMLDIFSYSELKLIMASLFFDYASEVQLRRVEIYPLPHLPHVRSIWKAMML